METSSINVNIEHELLRKLTRIDGGLEVSELKDPSSSCMRLNWVVPDGPDEETWDRTTVVSVVDGCGLRLPLRRFLKR